MNRPASGALRRPRLFYAYVVAATLGMIGLSLQVTGMILGDPTWASWLGAASGTTLVGLCVFFARRVLQQTHHAPRQRQDEF